MPEDPNYIEPYHDREEEKASRRETQSLKAGSSLVGSGSRSESGSGGSSGTGSSGTGSGSAQSESGETETAKLDQEDLNVDTVGS